MALLSWSTGVSSWSGRGRLVVGVPFTGENTIFSTLECALACKAELRELRILVKKRRSDHVRVEDLMKKSGLQSANAMVCSSSAMLAWRAADSNHPLHELFADLQPRGSTRSKEAGLLHVPPPSTKNLALWNMATVWNAIPELRAAKSEGMAKKVVKKFVRSLPV